MTDPVTTSWGAIAAIGVALVSAGGLLGKILDTLYKRWQTQHADERAERAQLVDARAEAAESEAVLNERHRCGEQIRELRAEFLGKIRDLEDRLAEARAEILELRVDAARADGERPLVDHKIRHATHRADRYKRQRDAERARADRQSELLLRIARDPTRAAETLEAVESADPAASLTSILSPSLHEASDPEEERRD